MVISLLYWTRPIYVLKICLGPIKKNYSEILAGEKK
jgi:hypothetical protein